MGAIIFSTKNLTKSFWRKRIIFSLGVFVILSVNFYYPAIGWCKRYYVKNSGDDMATGLSDLSAWKTISRVNRTKFSDGDTVCLKRGDTFSDSTFKSPGVNNFTIQDYGNGPKPHLNGNIIKPITIEPSKSIQNLTIKNIDISGQDWMIEKGSNMTIKNVHGVILDNISGNGHLNGKTSIGKTAITLTECSGEIVIKNCQLSNWGPLGLPKLSKDFMGIALISINEGSYDISNNVIHNVNADCVHLYHNTAKGFVHHNTLYNGGEDSIDVKGTHNTEIYENEFYRTDDFTGEGGSGSGGLPTLIVVHEGNGKEAKNTVIRDNKFHGGDAVGIKIGGAGNTAIYRNYFEKLRGAINIMNRSQDTIIHHNIIVNPKSRKGYKDMDGGCIYENNSYSGTNIYNNTIYDDLGLCKHLISIASCNKTTIKNNIVYQRNRDEHAYCFYFWPYGKDPVVQNNCWYNELSSNRVKYRNVQYIEKNLDSWRRLGHANDTFENPLFNDPPKGDFSLKINSPCLSETEYRGAVPFSPSVQKSPK